MTDQIIKIRVYRFHCPICNIQSTAILDMMTVDFSDENNIIPVKKACKCEITLNQFEENSAVTIGQRLNPLDYKIGL